MKKIYITLFILCTTASFLLAQHAPQYTHFMFNKLVYNPAYAGSNEVLTFSGLYRNQWTGIEGAPTTVNFNVHTPFFNQKCGAGLSIVSDQAGMLNTTYVNLSYAYRVKVNDRSTLSMGLMGRLEHSRLDWTGVETIDVDDELMGMGLATTVKPNFGVGLYLSSRKYYVGLSAPQLLANSLYRDLNIVEDIRTYYLMGGLILDLSEKVKFKPAVLFSYNPSAPFEVDLNANFIFMDALWVGGSYRLGDSFDAILAYQINSQLRAGAALDFTLTELQNYTSGGFELMVQYTFDYEDKKVNHLRYF